MTFGGLIRSLRMSDELSQVELAKKLGVSKQFLSDVEHNRKEVGISFAKKFSAVLGYSIEPLIASTTSSNVTSLILFNPYLRKSIMCSCGRYSRYSFIYDSTFVNFPFGNIENSLFAISL